MSLEFVDQFHIFESNTRNANASPHRPGRNAAVDCRLAAPALPDVI
jgi:hypothetical protein